MRRFDLVIVGGGPAGLSLALHLERWAPALAARTVLLERERYPREKFCAGAIGRRGLATLDAIGARPAVPAIEVEAMALAFPGGTEVVRMPGLGWVVRRLEFDHALARLAVERGIQVREGAEVRAVDVGRGGVRVSLAGGEALEARAVVGADGVGGIVRRAAGFSRGRLRARVLEADTEPVPGDPAGDTLLFDFADRGMRGYCWDFPTLVDGRRLVCRGAYVLGGEGPRAHLARHLARKGLDVGQVRLKPFAERGLDPDEPIARPRLLLAGEAAGIDITAGEGIAQALGFGALAARYLAECFETGDLGFAGWRERVRRSPEGRVVRARHAVGRFLYGAARPQIERLAHENPALLELGVRQFAGLPFPPAVVARASLAFARWSLTGGAPAVAASLWRGTNGLTDGAPLVLIE